MTRVVVLHELGDAAGGDPWRIALEEVDVSDVMAPDLPGHGAAAPPIGGNYVRADGGYLLAQLLHEGLDLDDAVLVGVGHSGWIATVAAIGGHCGALALIDGLGRPFRPVADRLARRRQRTRDLLADDTAMAVHDGPGPDPRLQYVLEPHGDQALAVEAAGLVRVPALVIEPEVDEATAAVVSSFGGAVQVHETDCTPEGAAAALRTWLDTAPI